MYGERGVDMPPRVHKFITENVYSNICTYEETGCGGCVLVTMFLSFCTKIQLMTFSNKRKFLGTPISS